MSPSPAGAVTHLRQVEEAVRLMGCGVDISRVMGTLEGCTGVGLRGAGVGCRVQGYTGGRTEVRYGGTQDAWVKGYTAVG